MADFLPLTDVRFIAIHCSATTPSMDIGVPELTRWHKERGFLTIGYHKVIRRDGTVEDGRPLNVMGAHVEGYNHCSIGVCMVGGVRMEAKNTDSQSGRMQALAEIPENNFTPAQWASLAKLIGVLHAQHPAATVQGHRDFPGVTKACPCFDAKPWYVKTFPTPTTTS